MLANEPVSDTSETSAAALTAGTAAAEEWDRFLESLPDSHHLQTSLWAERKRPSGWDASRLVLRQGGTPVAGLQILHRPVSRLGRIGYVPRGPVFAVDDARLPSRLMRQLQALMRSGRFRYVTVQPPRNGAAFVPELVASAFRATPFQVAPTATVLIDLQQSTETLLAKMRESTRRGVRTGLKSPLRIRRGGSADLPAFHSLLVATGQRRGFSPPALEYFRQMWSLFSRTDDIVLFLAQLGGETVAGELDITFGDTLVSKRAAWSGRHGKLHPNELLIWTAMNWARERGLKAYDMDGLDPELADALVAGTPISAAFKRSHYWFKLGFGGRLVILPDNYESVRLPLLGWAHRQIWCRWVSTRRRRQVLKRIGLM
jgi:lipid II:glycine glycyltransferase (peptidoglycan interpeptide bridge formation enzyme)